VQIINKRQKMSINKLQSFTFEVIVDAVVKECAGAEVDQSDVSRLDVDKDVFVLDVAVHNAGVVECYRRPDDLSEQAASFILVEGSALGDVVKQVLDSVRPFHHQYEAVRLLKVRDQSDHTSNARRTLQQTDLNRQPTSTFLLKHNHHNLHIH